MNMFQKDTLPDVTSGSRAENPLSLQWVGMGQIDVPLIIEFEGSSDRILSAKADIYVSLDNPTAKGIHMSRLHAILNRLAENECTKPALDSLLDDAVSSQAGISENARVRLAFDLMLKKPALLSEEVGYQAYPMVIHAERVGGIYSYEIEVAIPYSSTCPCSASLARQLYANALAEEFDEETIDKQRLLDWVQSEQGIVATPHSQRSYAYIKLALGENPWPEFGSLIRKFENVIGTPVQTAVKRRDEQEFARLNAQNLMFCEDAGRRIKSHLEAQPFVENYWFKVEHQESLHAHNAVVIDQK